MEEETPPEQQPRPGTGGAFSTTHWSVVLLADDPNSEVARRALNHLCQTYWYPLYVYVRRHTTSPHDAEDLTQGFLARFIANEYIKLADPTRGRFRSFLLTCLKNFMADEHAKAVALKRKPRPISYDGVVPEDRYLLEPVDSLSPDKLFEKRWAGDLLKRVLVNLAKAQGPDRAKEFELLKNFMWGDGHVGTYAEVAAQLGKTEGALKTAVSRLRGQYRKELEREIMHTVKSREAMREELQYLRTLWSS